MDYFSKRNFRILSSFLVKIICFIILFYSSILLTIDYFEFHYNYKLTIVSNNNELEIPAISFCTHNNQYFDKRKIIEFFNLNQLFNEYNNKTELQFEKYFLDCKKFNRVYCVFLKYLKKYKINSFYEKYEQHIHNSSFNILKSLLIESNVLILCSGFINGKPFSNCREKFEIEESFISDNEFGICFTFNSNIFLKRNDFIEFNINYESQQNILKKYSEESINEIENLIKSSKVSKLIIFLFSEFVELGVLGGGCTGVG